MLILGLNREVTCSVDSEYYYADNNVTPLLNFKDNIYLNSCDLIQTGRLTPGLEELTAHCQFHGHLDIDFILVYPFFFSV